MKVLCFYHGNCADGFGAAWVVRKFHAEKYPEAEIEFVSSVYQQTDPIAIAKEFFGEGAKGNDDVYVVDFSFTPAQMLELCRLAYVIHIDHHKTAIEKMGSIIDPRLTTYYSVKHSGAMLTWQYLFNDELPPPLLRHIEDRDLWKFKLPGTREIQANLFSHPYVFEVWDKLMADSYRNELLNLQASEGAAIERKHFKDIHELLAIVTRPMVIGGVEMPVANLPYIHSSDAGHILASTAPSKCAACYWDTPEGRIFSLRSSDDGPDVSAIAKQYGGGGHAHAAGFKVEPRIAMTFEAGENVWRKYFVDIVQ